MGLFMNGGHFDAMVFRIFKKQVCIIFINKKVGF